MMQLKAKLLCSTAIATITHEGESIGRLKFDDWWLLEGWRKHRLGAREVLDSGQRIKDMDYEGELVKVGRPH